MVVIVIVKGIWGGVPYRLRLKPPQPQAINRAKIAIMANTKRIIIHIRPLQLLQLPRVMIILQIHAIPFILKLLQAGRKAVPLAPKGLLLALERARLLLEPANLVLDGGARALRVGELAQGRRLLVVQVRHLARGGVALGLGGHLAVHALEELDVGVALARGVGEALGEALDEEVGAFAADGVVDVAAGAQNVKQPGRGAHLVAECVLVVRDQEMLRRGSAAAAAAAAGGVVAGGGGGAGGWGEGGWGELGLGEHDIAFGGVLVDGFGADGGGGGAGGDDALVDGDRGVLCGFVVCVAAVGGEEGRADGGVGGCRGDAAACGGVS